MEKLGDVLELLNELDEAERAVKAVVLRLKNHGITVDDIEVNTNHGIHVNIIHDRPDLIE